MTIRTFLNNNKFSNFFNKNKVDFLNSTIVIEIQFNYLPYYEKSKKKLITIF